MLTKALSVTKVLNHLTYVRTATPCKWSCAYNVIDTSIVSSAVCYVSHKTKNDYNKNLQYKSHQIPKLKCFSCRLAFVFAQSIEARSIVEIEYVVGAAPIGNNFIACQGVPYIKGLVVCIRVSMCRRCNLTGVLRTED